MVRRAGRVLVVAGSEKLGRRTFARICPAAAVHTLVTDTDAPAERVAEIRAAGASRPPGLSARRCGYASSVDSASS